MNIDKTVQIFHNILEKLDDKGKDSVEKELEKLGNITSITKKLKYPSNGTKVVMMLNTRALTPTVITSDDKAMELKKDSVYTYNGSEKFINSGPLLSLDKEQNFDYSFSTSFTVVF